MTWLLTAVAVVLFLGDAAAKTHPADADALRLLKAALDPASIAPGSCLSSWDFTAADPCDALSSGEQFTCGFRCDAGDPAGLARVTDISLEAAGYAGNLSPAVWTLPYLQTLDAADNQLSGSVPPPPLSLDLRQLRRIALSRNAFSGEIPLQMNDISGWFPDFSPLSSLTYLDASDNAISGRVLPAAALPPSLLKLSARNNSLQGPLPPDFTAGIPNLQVLDLSHNRLSGRVPAALFVHPALQQLNLAFNRFTSLESSPQWWRPAAASTSGLVAVDLGHNRLRGPLPLGWVRAMPRLASLTMEDNLLTGMIPRRSPAETPLSRLLLGGNYLYGPIPAPLMAVKEGEAAVSLVDNCLFQCPRSFFFCHGRNQKQTATCRDFNPSFRSSSLSLSLHPSHLHGRRSTREGIPGVQRA
ncbi:unnamed protein product [Spirodela intermedia]|uniref:Uncharacterized protein n=1 Tax=Spirodela intermedia TaxID=51605 RepID=A0A7I8JBU4_SPIIN|nr:unnamed protein product [Spirodela intermedia]CAA6666922.1 unnamed protein product [Spirodela intermedia]